MSKAEEPTTESRAGTNFIVAALFLYGLSMFLSVTGPLHDGDPFYGYQAAWSCAKAFADPLVENPAQFLEVFDNGSGVAILFGNYVNFCFVVGTGLLWIPRWSCRWASAGMLTSACVLALLIPWSNRLALTNDDPGHVFLGFPEGLSGWSIGYYTWLTSTGIAAIGAWMRLRQMRSKKFATMLPVSQTTSP